MNKFLRIAIIIVLGIVIGVASEYSSKSTIVYVTSKVIESGETQIVTYSTNGVIDTNYVDLR